MKTIETKIEKPVVDRFITSLEVASKYCVEKKLIVNGNEITDLDYFSKLYPLKSFNESLTKISNNRRKKLKKFLKRMETRVNHKTLNLFFHFLHTRMDLIKVTIKSSNLEDEIDILRVKYKKLFAETELVRKEFRSKKKEFYK